jgi:hypothetical protein
MYDTLAEALYANGRYNEAIDLEQKVMEHVLEIKQGDPEFFRSQIKRYVEARDKANGLPHK